MRKYNDALNKNSGCCLPCGATRANGFSELKPTKTTPDAQDNFDAELYWEDTVEAQYIQEPKVSNVEQRLETLNKQCIETQLMNLPVELREYIREKIKKGALKREIHGLVSGLRAPGP